MASSASTNGQRRRGEAADHQAYYAHSRNKSRTWCSMETCGNQAKARAFRRRHWPSGGFVP
ncbi:CGNR zinc finger domain-containing protein [Nocardia wallacei]|uniref:CGNR zinc finger domain-containing protein n=1 Tax=Nocardia wallacei TaxID=480035 RepID=UPI002454D816|nr:CGNR zinc finger domain-containing protein [Nocardia wallacei]